MSNDIPFEEWFRGVAEKVEKDLDAASVVSLLEGLSEYPAWQYLSGKLYEAYLEYGRLALRASGVSGMTYGESAALSRGRHEGLGAALELVYTLLTTAKARARVGKVRGSQDFS